MVRPANAMGTIVACNFVAQKLSISLNITVMYSATLTTLSVLGILNTKKTVTDNAKARKL